MSTESIQIHKTDDYSKFKGITSNREVYGRHVQAIVKSLRKRNLLWMNPIKVNDDFEVIDGQHRLAAAEILGVPVFYIVCPGVTKADLAILNSNQRNWSLMDFITFYTIEGHGEYKRLANLINKFSVLSISGVIRMTSRDNKSQSMDIRSGQLVLSGYDKCERICSQIIKIHKTFAPRYSFVLERNFMYCLNSMDTKNEFIDTLIDKVKKTPNIFVKGNSAAEYKKIIKLAMNEK